MDKWLWILASVAFGIAGPILVGHILWRLFPDGTLRWGQWRD